MPITVVCPGCHKRFNVSDKFAGKQGACPSCKGIIRVPTKAEEVQVHAPEFGPKDTEGRQVLKPIAREQIKLSPQVLWSIVAGSVFLLIVAALLGLMNLGDARGIVAGVLVGLVSPPLVFVGYEFMRDRDREPIRGRSLIIRTAIASGVYGGLWLAYVPISYLLMPGEIWQWFVVLPPLLLIGAFTAWAVFDIDFGSGFFHYAFYFVVTLVLLVAMRVSLVNGISTSVDDGFGPVIGEPTTSQESDDGF